MRLDPVVVRCRWSVVLERTVRELQGQPCIAFEDVPPDKQEIASTRSFGRSITELSDLVEAVSEFSARAAVKLREQNGRAGRVLVFVHTSALRAQDRQYSNSITLSLRRPSADTATITATTVRGMEAIFRTGFNYAKAGVMLLEIQAGNTALQEELALDESGADRAGLMFAMDSLNDRFGRGSVALASAGLAGDRRSWVMKPDF
jgi:DNA polymerase V